MFSAKQANITSMNTVLPNRKLQIQNGGLQNRKCSCLTFRTRYTRDLTAIPMFLWIAMQQNRLQNFPTKAERENSNDGLQTGSASATKAEAENQDGGLQTGIEITYILATLYDGN